MLLRCCWLWFKECCSSIVFEIHKNDLEASLMLFRLPLLSPYIYALWGKAHVDALPIQCPITLRHFVPLPRRHTCANS